MCATLMAHYAPIACFVIPETNHSVKPANRLPGWKERKAKELISNKLSEGLPVAKVANECALSRSHFSRSFKNNTGFSPKEWVIQTRISRAKEMLMNSGLPLAHIGAECGFSDQSHFTRAFGKNVGVTPRKWRQMNSRMEQLDSEATEA